MRIFLSGSTGVIGRRLIQRLNERGDTVVLLTRRAAVGKALVGPKGQVVEGDPMTPGAWMEAVKDCDGAVNLSGDGIFNKRWSEAYKKRMWDSRVLTTRHVVEALTKSPKTAKGASKFLVNASAIGFYGPHDDDVEITEQSGPGHDFMAELCVAWEAEAQKAAEAGIRVALLRTGVVLDNEGGAIKPMALPFKMFVGGPVGSGKQWMAWIHQADIVGLILLAIDQPEVHGPLNGTAPEPVTNREFSNALAKALHRPCLLPAPVFGIRIVLGEVADVITKGQRVVPARALALGYEFQFPTVKEALADIYK